MSALFFQKIFVHFALLPAKAQRPTDQPDYLLCLCVCVSAGQGLGKHFLQGSKSIFWALQAIQFQFQLLKSGHCAKATIDYIFLHCMPIKLYLWTLKFEFHINFMGHKILIFLWFISNRSEMWKHSQLRRQAGSCRIWPTGHSLPIPSLYWWILAGIHYSMWICVVPS